MPYDEADRVALHEAAHSLVNYIWTGSPGYITLHAHGGGENTTVWGSHLADDDDRAFLTYYAHVSSAGMHADQLAFGSSKADATSVDHQRFQRTLQALGEEGLDLTEVQVFALNSYCLRRYERPWKAAARYAHLGVSMPRQLEDEMLKWDRSLAYYHDHPLLSTVAGDDWYRRWQALLAEAMPEAVAYLRHAEEQAELRAMEAKLARQIAARMPLTEDRPPAWQPPRVLEIMARWGR